MEEQPSMQPDHQDQQQYGYAPPFVPPEQQQTSGMAITALILGILTFFTCGTTGIVALVLGIVAMSQIGKSQGQIKGHGLAVAGTILGAVGLVLPIFALLLGILLPALGVARHTANQMTNNTQLHGIHLAMMTYAQSNGTYFPGLNQNGNPDNLHVSNRFAILLDGNYFSPDYLINPVDNGITPAQPAAQGYTVTPQNYSYAALSIEVPGGRRDEWKDTLNAQAVVISDRNTGTPGQPSSVWTNGNAWEGAVAWNDGHVTREPSSIMAQTVYGMKPANSNDALFTEVGPDDALMVHDGK